LAAEENSAAFVLKPSSAGAYQVVGESDACCLFPWTTGPAVTAALKSTRLRKYCMLERRRGLRYRDNRTTVVINVSNAAAGTQQAEIIKYGDGRVTEVLQRRSWEGKAGSKEMVWSHREGGWLVSRHEVVVALLREP
jgi:hypothetical protein